MNQGRTDQCLKSINSLAISFQRYPFKYLLESDIQCDLFGRLRLEINEKISVPSSSESDYTLDLINSEYLDRFDLCCLNADVIESMSESDFQPNGKYDEYIYHLPVLLAIELKYIKGKYRQKGDFQKFLNDADKIRNSKFRSKVSSSLCICFIQDESVFSYHKSTYGNCVFTEVDSISELDNLYVVTPSSVYCVVKM
ncbi:hypothetical protein [Thalassolituus marinus]|uniref:Restriction endonuclease n=1 Tax=Thalassolituus marinus TaxID=671053 RepID=A0ABS7ZMN6_9GAMM|nr:hypothetical protein [Thalassolituus marinus]MCA6062965.1 hypothetical protein [Thalassolituus marinus]